MTNSPITHDARMPLPSRPMQITSAGLLLFLDISPDALTEASGLWMAMAIVVEVSSLTWKQGE